MNLWFVACINNLKKCKFSVKKIGENEFFPSKFTDFLNSMDRLLGSVDPRLRTTMLHNIAHLS